MVRKAVYVKLGELRNGESHAGVRAPIVVAMRRRNGFGAKGDKKVDA